RNEAWGTRYANNRSEASDFLEKSRQARDSEIEEKEKQHRKELKRTRVVAAVLAVAFLFAALVAAYAVHQKGVADKQGKANRQLLYVANMNLAGKAFEESRFSIGHEIVNRYLPTSAIAQQDDPRSFYWYFLWRINHQELVTMKGHGSIVLAVDFSNDAKTLASGSDDKTVKLWYVATRQELATLKGHGDSVSSVAFSNDGKTLASGSDDKTVKLWD